jgi:hypothetical protein
VIASALMRQTMLPALVRTASVALFERAVLPGGDQLLVGLRLAALIVGVPLEGLAP